MNMRTRITVAALCAVTAFLPSFAADRTIVSDYTLTADETVDGTLSVAPGVTVDLNGHNLTASALAGGGNSLIGGRYQILGYVTATGSQYVMTDYTPIASDRVAMKFRFADNKSTYQFIFCTRIPGSKQSFTILRNKGTLTNVRIDHGGNQKAANFGLTSGKDFVFIMNGGSGSCAAKNLTDGTTATANMTADVTSAPAAPFSILSGGEYDESGTTFTENSSYRCRGNFYWFKVNGRDGTLKCLIVPAKDTKGTADESDDEIGLYNLVSGTFLPPAVGTLTGGGEYSGEGGRIVNTSATLSELRVNVPEGVSSENSEVEVAGNVKFVKGGAGTLVASMFGQSYGGGTDVAAGVLKAGIFGNCRPFGLYEDNLLFNGSFDSGAITNGSTYQYAASVAWPENPGWTCDGQNAGLSKAGTAWVLSTIDVGNCAMYLRSQAAEGYGEANAEQTFRVRSPGRHRFTFAYMAATTNSRKGGTLTARFIHGGTTNDICSFTVPSANRNVFSCIVDLAEAGEYTLQFNLAAVADVKGVSIDDVEIAPVLEEMNLIRNGTFDESDIGSSVYKSVTSAEWPECPHWTCDGISVGLTTTNSTTWVSTGSRIGKYAVYLRTYSGSDAGGAWLEQTVHIDDPGQYAVRFSSSRCADSSRAGEPVNVFLNHAGETNLLMSVTATDTSMRCFGTVVDILEPGDYTLRFQLNKVGSATKAANIDDVYFARVPSVVVREGAMFDIAGQREFGRYPLVMDGGTFVNSGSRGAHDSGDSLLGTVLLSADSLFAITNSYSMRFYEYGKLGQAYMNLGGHELEFRLNGDHFYIEKCTITNGAIRVSEEVVYDGAPCYLAFIDGDSDATGVDMTLRTCHVSSNVTGIRNLTFADPAGVHYGSSTLYVNGALKSLMPKFPNIRLADGATLDLSENTGTFSLDGALDSRKISFADGATVALKLGARRRPTRIVGWTTAPANLDTLRFVPSTEDSGSRYRIVKKDDGLYIRTGFVVIVK